VGDFVFNIAKGRVNEYQERVDADDPVNSALVLVLLKAGGLEADAVLKDYDTLADVLAAANDECDFTNYARKTLTDADLGPTAVDDTNDRREADFADPVWTAAGGASNNSIGKFLVCYDSDTTGGTDANLVPLTAHDCVITTNGGDITVQLAVTGYFRAS